MTKTETEKLIAYAANADRCTPFPLYDSPHAPIYHYPEYFIRKQTMLRLGEDGVPEVVQP